MLQNFSRSDALSGINFQHLFQEIHGLRVNLFIEEAAEIESHFSIVLVDLFKLASLEKSFLGEQNVKDDSS